MSSDTVIRIKNLSKCFQIYDKPGDRLKQMIVPRFKCLFGYAPRQYFREFWALNDLSFEVQKGETLGIIGRNGSGKSTLLQLLCGTLTPTGGEVESIGRVAALLELGSGFNPEFTGKENIYMNASVLGLSISEIDARYDDIVKFADIGEFIDQPTKTYSSGMMVRLAFAVIVHVDADILIIDEALAVGDAFFTQKCMRFLRSFMKQGTVLFVSHDTAAVRSLCNRAIWLDKGAILEDGEPKIISEKYLEAFFKDPENIKEDKKATSVNRQVILEKVDIETYDQRDKFINSSNLRNDIKIFSFNEYSDSFGIGSAFIENVTLNDEDGRELSWMVGGENVVLKVYVSIKDHFPSPIVGFYIKDRLGQEIFGDNTYLTYLDHSLQYNTGDKVVAEFHFKMPRLAVGDYSVTVAVAQGDQMTHKQHHWVHDALTFRSQNSNVVGGIVGIPMQKIQLKENV